MSGSIEYKQNANELCGVCVLHSVRMYAYIHLLVVEILRPIAFGND